MQTTRLRFNPIGMLSDRLSRWPWWALVAALLGVLFAWYILTDQTYRGIFERISEGILVTLRVTALAYGLALVLGLIVALGRVSNNVVVYQIATFYVEIIRGVPTLVLLLYIAFVIFPAAVDGLNALGTRLMAPTFAGLEHYPPVLDAQLLVQPLPPLLRNVLFDTGKALDSIELRNIENEARVIVALTVAYSAFLAEIFRAGIESIDKGQTEAARTLGLNFLQTMLSVILPQALRVVLAPATSNSLELIKTTVLASVIALPELMKQAEQAHGSMASPTPLVMAAIIFLVMLWPLVWLAGYLERKLAQ